MCVVAGWEASYVENVGYCGEGSEYARVGAD